MKKVLALGFFDGVHIGHAALMRRAAAIAAEREMEPAVVTFDAHPMSMVTGGGVRLINSPADRRYLIHKASGITDVIFLHFDERFMKMPWDAFIEMLVRDFDAGYLVCGHDYSFGYRGEGNPEKLAEKCGELGVGCEVIAPVEHLGIRSSSTYIRDLIAGGEMERANGFLGHAHIFTGVVYSGKQLGRRIGAPTINMRFGGDLVIPRHGVYATRVDLGDGRVMHGVTNVGVRPTVDSDDTVTAETYILGFDGDLYGVTVRLEFLKFIRPERRFDTIEELKEQIARDAGSVRRYFEETE